MINPFEYKGYWFLPSKRGNKVAGILKYSPSKRLNLELLGSLEKEDLSHFFSKDKSVDIIWGITSDAKKISLISCFGTISRNFSSPFSLLKYQIRYCVVGEHIQGLSDKRFDWCNITIPALSKWCHPKALTSRATSNIKKEAESITVSFETNEFESVIDSVRLENGTLLEVCRGVNYSDSFDSLIHRFSQYTFLRIEKSKKASLQDFLYDIHKFENFMSLVSLDIINTSIIQLYDDTLYQSIDEDKKIYHHIELYYFKNPTELNIEAPQKRDFLFNYDQIEGKFENIMKAWFKKDPEIDPIRAHLIQSIERKSYFSSVDFLIVIQALEGFGIRFRKEQALRQILKDLLVEFHNINKIKQMQIDVNSVVDSRHYYSHFMLKSKKPKVLDGMALYDLTKKLRILLVCCTLNYIGFNNNEIEKLFNKCYNFKLAVD